MFQIYKTDGRYFLGYNLESHGRRGLGISEDVVNRCDSLLAGGIRDFRKTVAALIPGIDPAALEICFDWEWLEVSFPKRYARRVTARKIKKIFVALESALNE